MSFVPSAKKLKKHYDVVIVGSGAAGGLAAYLLAKAGVNVLMLEAGRNYDPVKEAPMFNTNADAALRATGTPEMPTGPYIASREFWVVPGEPYVVKDLNTGAWREATNGDRSRPNQNFMWNRSRMLGGRTNHWGRLSLRMGPYDFKPKTRDGLGFDWPIGYDELAPYYDKVDQLVGISGSKEGLENNPDSEFFQPPPKPRFADMLIQRSGKDLGHRFIPARLAVLTKPLNGRAPCIYATPCVRGCSIGAAFQTPDALIAPAMATGKLDVLTNAIAREVTLDANGRANGINYIDQRTKSDEHVSADAIFLGASACESARILLNSKSKSFPQGLGNSSGHLGRWLTDSVKTLVSAQLPALEGSDPVNEDGIVGAPHMYAPWTRWSESKSGKLGFSRGYTMAVEDSGRSMPGMDNMAQLLGLSGDLYGSSLKARMRQVFGTTIGIGCSGEMIPNEQSYVELDPEKKDKWGIPVLRFHFQRSEQELKMAAHQQQSMSQIIEAAGGKLLKPLVDPAKAMVAGGSTRHEVGVTRMSAKPKDGVTDPFGSVWDCPNVYVGDGGVFVSNSAKHPTLTILALAWRACENLLDKSKKRV